MKNGQDDIAMVSGVPAGPETNAQLSIEDLFSIIGRKQVLLEVLQTRVEQLSEMNVILQKEIALLKQGLSIPELGIDETAGGR